MLNCQEDIHKRRVAQAKDGALSAESVEKVSNLFRVLGEPSRLKIVLALYAGELCVYHILELCGGTQSGVSHQLRVLKDNGVLKCRRDGQNVLYSIADDHIRDVVGRAVEHLSCGVIQ